MPYIALNHKIDRRVKNDIGSNEILKPIAHLNFEEPAAKSITAILEATDLTDEEQTITEGITDPDVARNIRIKASKSGTDPVAGDVVVHGTNINNDAISETLTLDDETDVAGDKAFKTITSVELPIETNAGEDGVVVGTDNKLGIPYKLELNTILKAYRDGNLEGTDPTVATDTGNIEENTILLDSALNGTDVDVLLIVQEVIR